MNSQIQRLVAWFQPPPSEDPDRELRKEVRIAVAETRNKRLNLEKAIEALARKRAAARDD